MINEIISRITKQTILDMDDISPSSIQVEKEDPVFSQCESCTGYGSFTTPNICLICELCKKNEEVDMRKIYGKKFRCCSQHDYRCNNEEIETIFIKNGNVLYKPYKNVNKFIRVCRIFDKRISEIDKKLNLLTKRINDLEWALLQYSYLAIPEHSPRPQENRE